MPVTGSGGLQDAVSRGYRDEGRESGGGGQTNKPPPLSSSPLSLPPVLPWKLFYFFSLSQGQGSLRPTEAAADAGFAAPSSSRLVRSCRVEGGTAA